MAVTSKDRQAMVEELADIIMSLQRCFMMNLSKELTRGKVSFSQYFLLGHLGSAKEHLSMSEIAHKMNHTTAAATGMIDRLENLGYVQRVHTENDRRKVFVKSTKKGAALVSHIRQDIINNLTSLVEVLPEDDRHAWLRVYRKVFDYCQNTKQ